MPVITVLRTLCFFTNFEEKKKKKKKKRKKWPKRQNPISATTRTRSSRMRRTFSVRHVTRPVLSVVSKGRKGSVRSDCSPETLFWWWHFPRMRGLWRKVRRIITRLRFFFFFFNRRSARGHTNPTLQVRFSLYWLSELRWLWTNVLWRVMCELVFYRLPRYARTA